MPRVRKGSARKKAKNRLFKAVKGYRGGRHRLYRTAKEALVRAQASATRDRRTKKRTFRSLWITRISAGLSSTELTYSKFTQGLKKAGVALNTKSLAEIARTDEKTFGKLVKLAAKSL
jgi:large subunit ribosomal protein L20